MSKAKDIELILSGKKERIHRITTAHMHKEKAEEATVKELQDAIVVLEAIKEIEEKR